MAVRADDIALGDLLQDARDASAADHPGDRRPLRPRIAMIEIHRTGRESIAAIRARDAAEVVKELTMMPPAPSLRV
jgi:hypothetical protein